MRAITQLLLIGSATVAPRAAAAQQWHPSARFSAEILRDGNPFLLTAAQHDRLSAPSQADSISGRFRNMESATDVVPVATADVALAGPGAFGRPLELSTEVAYEANVHNARRRHSEISVALEQSLPKAGRARLRADWRPSYFWKNYLSDAVDVSGDGNITSDERIYSPGTSDEVDLTLNVRRRLAKTVRGELEVGYFTRGYDAPFSGRDRRGPGVGAGVAVDVGRGRRWTLGLDYAFQALHSDVVREVQILDETAFGVDFNGINGATDVAARAFELVDRSRVEHNVETSVETELSNDVALALIYARRLRVFGSSQPYDVADRGRRDTRNEFAAELTVRIAHGLRWTLSGTATRQSTNRSGDPGSTGDVADYTRSVIATGLAYRF